MKQVFESARGYEGGRSALPFEKRIGRDCGAMGETLHAGSTDGSSGGKDRLVLLGSRRYLRRSNASVLKEHSVTISLDGKGLWLENVFVERL